MRDRQLEMIISRIQVLACQQRDRLASDSDDLLNGLHREVAGLRLQASRVIGESLVATLARRLQTGSVAATFCWRPHPTHEDSASALTGAKSATPRPFQTAVRWAALVARVVDAPTDPATLDAWGNLAHASRSTLENRCRSMQVSAKASLDFGRVLRAIHLAKQSQCPPSALLDCDPRTLGRLVAAAHIDLSRAAVRQERESVFRYISRQTFIGDSLALSAIVSCLPADVIVS